MYETIPAGLSYGVAFPGKELRNFISHFWCSRFDAGVQHRFRYHSTANTTTELVFAFAGDVNIFSSAQGHTGSHSCIETGGFEEMFGVAIYSHALPYFFDVSALEFADELVELERIADVALVSERLAGGSNFNQRVDIVTQFLLKRFYTARKIDTAMLYAIQCMRQKRGQVNIVALAGECCLSQKQFERRFKHFTGFNPKLYSRVLRFENSLCRYDNGSRLTDLALDLGYYDQAHFINDFKLFAGCSPGKFAPITLE